MRARQPAVRCRLVGDCLAAGQARVSPPATCYPHDLKLFPTVSPLHLQHEDCLPPGGWTRAHLTRLCRACMKCLFTGLHIHFEA